MRPTDDSPRLPNFDPTFCLRVFKWGAATCLAWLTIAVCILAFVDPANSRCPGWIIYARETREPTSLWLIVILFAAAPTIWICLRWRRTVQRYYDAAMSPDPPFPWIKRSLRPDLLTFPHNQVLMIVVVIWSLFCTAPLWIILANCANFP